MQQSEYFYTQEQENFLKKNYFDMPISEISKLLNRSKQAIIVKANKMGLKHNNNGRFQKGIKPWNTGTKKMTIINCKKCEKLFSYPDWANYKFREFCSKGCATSYREKGVPLPLKDRINMSLAKTGEKEFTGFKKPLYKRIRLLPEYVKWRFKIFERDLFTCQNCDTKGVYLEAHHIKSFLKIVLENEINSLQKAKDCKELWNLDNGITFCRECHLKIDKNIGKQRRKETWQTQKS